MVLFRAPDLDATERRVIDLIERIRDSLSYATSTPTRWFGQLARGTRARALQGSNSIEGYNVTVDDALAAIENGDPMEASREDWNAVRGYRNALTFVLQLADDPHFHFTEAFVRSMHFMMLEYDLSKHPGKWRPGPIYVRDERKREIVYEAPDADEVPPLMRELMESLEEQSNEHVLIRAAISHLNLVMIHPFSDGNGRMARCLQTLVLARQRVLERHFCSIEEYLGYNTNDYYQVLADVGRGVWSPGDYTRPWIRFNLTAHYRQAATLLNRTRETQRAWDELETELRRRALPDRYVYALVDATFGWKVRNSTYRLHADVSENLASRDLKDMVDAGLLIPEGQKRARFYRAAPFLQTIRGRIALPRKIPSPFEVIEQQTLPFGTT